MENIDNLKNTRMYIIVFLIALLHVSCDNSKILFQENTTDWFEKGDASWSFSNDELIGKIKDGAGYLITKESYKNFTLELEFNPDSTINSGVFLRCRNNDISPINCYEVNIWDLHPNQDYRTGAIVLKSNPLAIVETIDKWNTYKIKIEKDHIKVWINGILTTDIKDKTFPEGYVGLQAKGTGEVKFRNIKITKMQ